MKLYEDRFTRNVINNTYTDLIIVFQWDLFSKRNVDIGLLLYMAVNWVEYVVRFLTVNRINAGFPLCTSLFHSAKLTCR